MERNVTQVYFSPSGTTAKVAGLLADGLGLPAGETIDLLRQPPAAERAFGPGDVVVVSLPVFGGRLPHLCLNMLQKLQGNGAAAIAAAVYGNANYDDALLELVDVLTDRGFAVAGAGLFVAQHSIFPAVAAGRPDAGDEEIIRAFAGKCAQKLQTTGWEAQALPAVPGNRPYKDYGGGPLRPSADDSCTLCGACADICPLGAIPADAPNTTDSEKCTNCTACICECPVGSRGYHMPQFEQIAAGFGAANAKRQEPQVFV